MFDATATTTADITADAKPVITIIDAIMGAGKTTYIIDHINRAVAQSGFSATGETPDQRLAPRFVYVTPMLEECQERLPQSCPMAHFKNPVPVHGSKFYDFKCLLQEGQNIATTHELFKKLDREAYDLLKGQGYTLIIDEALTCLEVFDELTPEDRGILFDQGMVYIEDTTGRLRWNNVDHGSYEGKFTSIKNLCDNGNLVTQGKGKDGLILFWEFAADFLTSFRKVFILTYMFDASPMSLYLALEGFTVDMRSIHEGQLVFHEAVDEAAIKAKLRRLISIYEGPKNAIGERQFEIREGRKVETGAYPFSAGWYAAQLRAKDKGKLAPLGGTVRQYFIRDAKTPAALNGWTCLKKAQSTLSGPGYAKGFIPSNAKATNKYAEKQSLAYLVSVFYQTPVKSFFESRGMSVSEELYALSEMVQWIWRSAIRNDKPISIYIPSERMRSLLKRWLASDSLQKMILDMANEDEDRREEVRRRLSGKAQKGAVRITAKGKELVA